MEPKDAETRNPGQQGGLLPRGAARGLTPLLLLLALPLFGCATLDTGHEREQAALAPHDRAELLRQLRDSASRIQESLDRMVSVHQAALKSSPAHPPKPVSGPFARRVDFVWGGPIEPALSALASIAGLPPPEVKGRRPAVPITVHLEAVDRSVGELLEDIGWRAGDRAWVHLDAERGRIVLGYPTSSAELPTLGSAPLRDDPVPEGSTRGRKKPRAKKGAGL